MDLNSDEVFLSEKLHQTSRSMPNAARAACSRRSSNLAARGAAPLCCCSCLWNRDGEGVWSLLNDVFCWQQTSKIKCVLLFFQLFSHLASGPADWPFQSRGCYGSHRGHGCCLQARLQLAVSHELGQSHCGVRMCRELNHCSDS